VSITPTRYQELKDGNGRIYRVGETPRDLVKRPRWLMVLLPWFGMLGISVSEYAFGSAGETLHDAHGWSTTNIFWLLSIWVFFQAAIAFPAGKPRENGKLTARAAMILGAAGAFIGFISLGHAPNLFWAYLGFGVFGGGGAGLVYATCVTMVAKWYPENYQAVLDGVGLSPAPQTP